jgi:hypothetical protein
VLKITTPEDAESPDLMEHQSTTCGRCSTRIWELSSPSIGDYSPLVTSEDWLTWEGPRRSSIFAELLVVAHTAGTRAGQRLLSLEEHCLHGFNRRPTAVDRRGGPAARYSASRPYLRSPIDVNFRDEPLDGALAQLAASTLCRSCSIFAD